MTYQWHNPRTDEWIDWTEKEILYVAEMRKRQRSIGWISYNLNSVEWFKERGCRQTPSKDDVAILIGSLLVDNYFDEEI